MILKNEVEPSILLSSPQLIDYKIQQCTNISIDKKMKSFFLSNISSMRPKLQDLKLFCTLHDNNIDKNQDKWMADSKVSIHKKHHWYLLKCC